MTSARMRSRGWDAVVVGARVAGASTALLLARAGLRVLVVDRCRRGSDTLSTHALMRGGVLLLRRWGLLDRVVASGAPPVRRVTFHYGADSMPISLKPYGGVEALYAPRRTVLDSLLVDAAEAAGAQFRFGVTVTDLVTHGGRVTGVVLHDRGQNTWTERAGLVVGADGRNSVVAAQVAAPTLKAGSHRAAYAYGYWPAADLSGYHWYYGDALSAGVIPTNDGQACIFVAGPPARLIAASRRHGPVAAQRSLLRRLDDGRLADLASAPSEGPVRVFRGLPARLRGAYGPGWALVGDAGCWKDPLSTHGITAAFRDADSLAAAVVAGAASARATDVTLAGYQSRRDQVALAMHPIVDRLASHEWDLAEARLLLLGLSSVMADEVDMLAQAERVPARTA